MVVRFTKELQNDKSYVVGIVRRYIDDPDISMEEVAEKLKISRGCVAKCIYIAGINNWISFQTLCDIKAKEHFQQSKHYNKKEVRTTSDKRFEEIFKKRREAIRTNLTREYCEKIVRIYIDYASDRKVYERCGLSYLEMNDVLIKGAIIGWITDQNFRMICEISALKSGSKSTMAAIKKAREEYPFLPGEIKERERMLENYDEVFSDADEAPSKEFIENEIARKKARLEEIKNFIEGWHHD